MRLKMNSSIEEKALAIYEAFGVDAFSLADARDVINDHVHAHGNVIIDKTMAQLVSRGYLELIPTLYRVIPGEWTDK